jgi:hypothetical protein
MKINAENKELVVKNKKGDIAIIPVIHRKRVLELLEKGDHTGLDRLIEKLPVREDYAEDGTLVTTDPVPKKETKSPNYTKAIFTPDQYKQLENEYLSNPKYIKYSAETKGAGCVGSSCKNFKTLHPSLTGFYEDYEKAYKEHPEYKGQVVTDNTGAEKPQGSSKGVDAWEAADFIVYNKLGEHIVDANDPEYLQKLMDLDVRDIPIGSMLTFGEARGKYVNPKAKNWRGEENTALTQHGGTTLGYVEDVDEEGNKVYNLVVDELGLKTIGPGKNAWSTWKGYVSSRGGSGESAGMRGIVKRYSSDIDYWKATGQEKPKSEVVYERPKQEQVLKDIDQYKKDMLESIRLDEEAGWKPKGSYQKALKEGIKVPPDMLKQFATSIGIGQGNKVVRKKEPKQ